VTKVAIVAASGYIGGELLRILLQHPDVELTAATSRSREGEYVFRTHPNLRGMTEMKFTGTEGSPSVRDADVVFVALPHGESVGVVPELAESGCRVIDLSADFRLKDGAEYTRWYGRAHGRPDLLAKFVYAIPELNRDELKGARLAAVPGCMAITSILALAPLLKGGRFGADAAHLVVDAKVGSSGSGGKPSLFTHFSERYNVVRPYELGGHRHAAEIEQVLASISKQPVKVSMSAHGVNMVRGILCTCHLFTESVPSPLEVWKAYREAYVGSYFVRLVREKEGPYRLPDPKLVIGSNFCDIGFEIEERTGRIVTASATDNLVKGAAGNAVQSMNVMLGLDETAGLRSAPLHPV
jgi:[amino group carrier protein]-6-phospho-L-2-aminoadipate/5-phospho-L-glutamate reductase